MPRRSMPWLVAAVALSWGAAANAAEVKVAPYGATTDGRKVTAYTLVNDKGASATILDFGGAVEAIRVPDRDGKLTNVAMSFQDMRGWEAAHHVNSITGRFANTITGGFDLDGVHYALHPDDRGVTMHGGVEPYAARIWTVQPVKKADGAAVTMVLLSPDGDQGFPGNLKLTVKYSFSNANELRIDFGATTDKATVLNLTNHIYFNLNGNSAGSVYDQELQEMTDQAGSRTPGKRTESVVGTVYDFTKPDLIGKHIAYALGPQYDDATANVPLPPGMTRGFSEPYLLHDGDNRLDRVAARLSDPKSGRVLEVRTTEVSVHTFLPGPRKDDILTDAGKPFTRGQAIAFETQHLPNSPNRPEFPTTVLRPGQTFKSSTIFAFKVEPKP